MGFYRQLDLLVTVLATLLCLQSPNLRDKKMTLFVYPSECVIPSFLNSVY